MSTLADGRSMHNWSQHQSGTKGDLAKIMDGSSTYVEELNKKRNIYTTTDSARPKLVLVTIIPVRTT